MTGPAPQSADWCPFVKAVAEHQIRSERDAVFLRDRAEIEQNLTGRRAFHRALSSESVSVEELVALAAPLSGPAFGAADAAALADLRRYLARCPAADGPLRIA